MKSLFIAFVPVIILINNNIGNAQSCTITCPANLIVMADKNKEGANVSFPNAIGSGDCGAITYAPAAGSFFRLGSHSVIAMAASGQKCSFTVTVVDNQAPQLSELTLSKKRLWPVSNKMKKIGVYYTSSDNGMEVKSVLTVSSNSSDSMNRDWEVVNDHLLRLKASRLANGEPRIYYITVTTTDAAGNITKRTTSIAVSETMEAMPGTK